MGQKKGPLRFGSRPVVSVNVLTQPGAPPERMRLRLTVRLTVRGAVMVRIIMHWDESVKRFSESQQRQFLCFPLVLSSALTRHQKSRSLLIQFGA
jgi:hypothetical protein